MARVMHQRPSHQFLVASPDHPTGHACAGCTVTYPPRVVGHRLTNHGAEKAAERLNAWSIQTGHYYAERGWRVMSD